MFRESLLIITHAGTFGPGFCYVIETWSKSQFLHSIATHPSQYMSAPDYSADVGGAE